MPQITIPLSKYLYKTMATLYDDWLDDHGLCDNQMRFEDQEAFIWCFAHILNLIVQKILKTLGSSTNKQASDHLDLVAKSNNKVINVPLGQGVIAIHFLYFGSIV